MSEMYGRLQQQAVLGWHMNDANGRVSRKSCCMNDDQRKRFFPAALLAAAIALIGLGCRWTGTRFMQGGPEKSVEPHRTFPGDCGLCHVGQGWNNVRPAVSFDHEEETGHRLEGAHAGAGCLACHNDRGPVTIYIARGCGGCHPDPHASALGPDCQTCHSQTDWTPTGSTATSVEPSPEKSITKAFGTGRVAAMDPSAVS